MHLQGVHICNKEDTDLETPSTSIYRVFEVNGHDMAWTRYRPWNTLYIHLQSVSKLMGMIWLKLLILGHPVWNQEAKKCKNNPVENHKIQTLKHIYRVFEVNGHDMAWTRYIPWNTLYIHLQSVSKLMGMVWLEQDTDLETPCTSIYRVSQSWWAWYGLNY